MTLDLSTFTRIVRPAKTMDVAAAEVAFRTTATEEPILMFGIGTAGVVAFERAAANVGYGSAMVLTGVPTESIDVVDRAEGAARAHDFRSWFRGTEVPEFPADARTWVKSADDGGYGSHLPHLLEAVRRTTGDVLELGAGEFSTPALSAECAKTGRRLATVESDAAWLARVAKLVHESHHDFHSTADPASTDLLRGDLQWSVVFVDHAPGNTRGQAIERARSLAEYIVVHDSEDLGYGIEELLSSFKYRKDFRRVRPWTTVVSMTREIW